MLVHWITAGSDEVDFGKATLKALYQDTVEILDELQVHCGSEMEHRSGAIIALKSCELQHGDRQLVPAALLRGYDARVDE